MTQPEIFARPEMQVALAAVREAALLAAQIQAEMRRDDARLKSDHTPVTVADFAAQAVIAARLAEAFPHDALVAEEGSDMLADPSQAALASRVLAYVRRLRPQATASQVAAWIARGGAAPSHRFWTLDPIDGTKGFLRGGQYAVALALVEAGQVQVGVLGCPALVLAGEPGVLAAAWRGHGAWWTRLAGNAAWQPLRVSSCRRPEEARLLRSFEDTHTDTARLAALQRLLGLRRPPLRMDSQAKYVVLAAGEAELMVRLPPPQQPNYREKLWDQAAGALVLHEAGGQVTDARGRPFDFRAGRALTANLGVAASNRLLHDALLTALQQVLA